MSTETETETHKTRPRSRARRRTHPADVAPPRPALSALTESVRSSDSAQFVIALVRRKEAVGGFAVPEASRRALLALLSDSVGAPSQAELRERQLGLLWELIDRRAGHWPSADDYAAEQEDRAALGQRWPTLDQLREGWGGFEKACRQAWRMWENGTDARVPHTRAHARLDQPVYQRHHVIEALHDFRSERGFWPTQWEYEEWARCERRTMRLTGENDPRPGLARIRELFTSWDRALEVAVRAW
jgi:hypothetical protein